MLEGLLERTHDPKKRVGYQAELDCPPMPAELSYLWVAFNRLSSRRGSNGFGINPIGWAELDAFIRLSRTRLTPWDIEIIEMLDDLFRASSQPEELER